MFEEWFYIIGFMIFSIIVSYILMNYTSGLVSKIFRAIAMTGIIFHELCHVLMCLLTNTPIEKVNLLKRSTMRGERGNIQYLYSGSVLVKDRKSLTFLKALIIALAPLLISFWVFFYLLSLLLYGSDLAALSYFLIVFFMASIMLAASPSFADVRVVSESFNNDISYSMYQIFLLSLSIICVWVFSLSIMIIHEIILYLLIFAFYVVFKYSIKIVQSLINSYAVGRDTNTSYIDKYKLNKTKKMEQYLKR